MSTTFKRLYGETTSPTLQINVGSIPTQDVDAGFGIDAAGMPALYDTSGTNVLGVGDIGTVPVMIPLGTITGATSTGIKLATANPAGATLMIHSLMVRVTTQSTNANTVDIGVAADAVTSSDTLIDGASTQGTAPFVLDDQKNAGTNGSGPQLWTSSQFVTVNANTDATGLVAIVYAVVSKLPV